MPTGSRHSDSLPRSPFWRRPRYQYAAGAFLLGVIDITLARAIGFDFRLGDRDVTLWVGLFLELSFAGFGYLLGLLVESRRAERLAAQRIQEQLEEIASTRARLAQHEKLASLGQLASTLAHEVRNPLAIIRSQVQNLQETFDGKDDESVGACRAVLEEIDRLSRVVTSLVGFSRPLELHRADVPPADVVGHTEQLAQPLLRQHRVKLQTEVVGAPFETAIDADPDLLCQVLLGLLTNAAEATPAGGRVRLSLRRSDDGVRFDVVDEGGGVPSDLREKIFEPFFTTREEGSGLGLPVARQIVEAHGGRLELSDDQGGGACFSVHLRAAARAA